jgi:hypothetical protein
MGVFGWVKGLFRKKARTECDLCHNVIPQGDFDSSRAVMIARRKFCRGCVDYVTGGGQSAEQRSKGLWPTMEHSSSTRPVI